MKSRRLMRQCVVEDDLTLPNCCGSVFVGPFEDEVFA